MTVPGLLQSLGFSEDSDGRNGKLETLRCSFFCQFVAAACHDEFFALLTYLTNAHELEGALVIRFLFVEV